MKKPDRPVKGYEGSYTVSEYGIITSLDRMEVSYSKKKKCFSRVRLGRIMTQRENPGGYLLVHLSKNNKQKWLLAHRIVAFAFIKPVEGKLHINHKDGNKKNNHVDNLEWVTISENAIHASRVIKTRHQNFKKCDQHRMSILNSSQVKEIRKKYIPHVYSQNTLAREYKVSRKCIDSILKNKTWKNEDRSIYYEGNKDHRFNVPTPCK